MKTTLSIAGRLLFAVPFLGFGIHHLMAGPAMAPYVPAMFPDGAFWIYLTGIALIAAAISLVLQKYGKIAMLLLSLFLLVVIVTMQVPAVLNPATRDMGMVNLFKDTGLLGGALTYAAIFTKN